MRSRGSGSTIQKTESFIKLNDPDNPVLNTRAEELGHLLRWEGELNRQRVMRLYGVGPVRASGLLRSFREAHPEATRWDSRSKSYIATDNFFSIQSAAQEEGFDWYLARAGLPAARIHAAASPVWVAFPDFARPQPKIFSALYRAITERRQAEITYRSMKEPAAHTRLLEPHGLVRAGRRWHLRAFSVHHQQYRDFSLGRILKVQLLEESQGTTPDDDAAWNAAVRVVLVAHPALTADQADVVRHEYFQGTARRVETTRGALVAYFVQDIRAAVDVAKQAPPDYQLAVENTQEVKPWLFPA